MRDWHRKRASAMPMREFRDFRAESADEGHLVPEGSRFPAPEGFCLVSTDEIRGGEGTPVRVVHPDPALRVQLVPDRPMPGDWYQFELRFPPEGLVDVVAQFSFAGGRV